MHLEENNSLTSPILILASISVISGSLIAWVAPLKQEIIIIHLCEKYTPLVLVAAGAALA
jgi:hypothetical protein